LTPGHRLAVTVRPARDDAEVRAAQRLRVEVFCDEQGVPVSLELDGLDEEAAHLVALDGDEVIATCRLRYPGATCRLERMAVRRDRRATGVGAALLAGAEQEARRAGAGEILLHGQLAARAFYERGGYETLSEEIINEASIDHVAMRKEL
jgi:predicted GNAT family N-acyltransferase